MDIKEVQGQGTVGKSIELSTQEIRVFNKKWFEVKRLISGKETVRVDKGTLEQLNNLFFKWFGDVPMDEDIEAMMFGHPEEDGEDIPLTRL